MEDKAVRMLISGRVQGVFFRANTKDRAKELNIEGWVKNLSNGDVEIFAQGKEEDLNQLKNWAEEGPPKARVDDVKTEIKEARKDLEGFRIKY